MTVLSERLIFFVHFRNVKVIFTLKALQKLVVAQIWPSLLPHVPDPSTMYGVWKSLGKACLMTECVHWWTLFYYFLYPLLLPSPSIWCHCSCKDWDCTSWWWSLLVVSLLLVTVLIYIFARGHISWVTAPLSSGWRVNWGQTPGYSAHSSLFVLITYIWLTQITQIP